MNDGITEDIITRLTLKITAGNVDDRDPVPELTRALFGKLVGDRGYISQALFEHLWEQGMQLITKLRKKMKKCVALFSRQDNSFEPIRK